MTVLNALISTTAALVARTPAEIYALALAAAQEGADIENTKLGPESARGFDCGFAWVVITPARGAFVNYCKANKIGSKHWQAGWEIWGSSLHNISTQSITVHQAACREFERVLNDHGVSGHCGSRLD